MKLGMWILLLSLAMAGCTSEKCDPKSGEACNVLPETIGLSAFQDPVAPSGTPSLPSDVSLIARLLSTGEVMVRDGEKDVISILYLPFSIQEAGDGSYLARLAGARGYSFSHPQLPAGCSISQLGYSHLQTESRSGVLEFSAREAKDGPKPCLGFFRGVLAKGLDIQFSDVPVYGDRPPLQIRIQARPLPELPRTASRPRKRNQPYSRLRAD